MGGREEMESIAADLGKKYKVKTITVNLDVTNTDSVQKMAVRVKEKFGNVDALFNNAGRRSVHRVLPISMMKQRG